MKDNRNRYNEKIEKYQSMDQFQVGIAVFDPVSYTHLTLPTT